MEVLVSKFNKGRFRAILLGNSTIYKGLRYAYLEYDESNWFDLNFGDFSNKNYGFPIIINFFNLSSTIPLYYLPFCLIIENINCQNSIY